MNPKIKDYIEDLDTSTIAVERKQVLHELINYIQQKIANQQDIQLNFICTHNSRRSHLGQVWAQTMAAFYDLKSVICFSGGTEETAVYPQIIETFKTIGFNIVKTSSEDNPTYTLQYDENTDSLTLFSKIYDHPTNPKTDFLAVMTCSNAYEDCPYIPGAAKRINLSYEDPKAFDNTEQMAQKYLDKSKEIATELKYVFSQIKVK